LTTAPHASLPRSWPANLAGRYLARRHLDGRTLGRVSSASRRACRRCCSELVVVVGHARRKLLVIVVGHARCPLRACRTGARTSAALHIRCALSTPAADGKRRGPHAGSRERALCSKRCLSASNAARCPCQSWARGKRPEEHLKTPKSVLPLQSMYLSCFTTSQACGATQQSDPLRCLCCCVVLAAAGVLAVKRH
jgi:hypothetical protein